MLAEIAAEAMHFLSRRDLDKASGISKWLDTMIAYSSDMYPLRRVQNVALYRRAKDFTLNVRIQEHTCSRTEHSFGRMDEALWSVAPVPDHWTTLVHAIRGGTVRDFHFSQVDFSALDDDAFLVAICLHGLQSIALWTCVVPSGFVTDDLLRSGIAKGLVDLRFVVTKIDRLSEDAILDFCFPGDAVPGGRSQCLVLEGSGVTDMFVKNFFERITSTPARPTGTLKFVGTAKQRGLSAFAQYLVPPDGWSDDTYRFPFASDNNTTYVVTLLECPSFVYMNMRLYHGHLGLS